MIYIQVLMHVKPNRIEDFIKATLDNVHNSKKEEGIKRFELLQEIGRPDHFLLDEIYLDIEARAKHRKTSHYKKWRKEAEFLLAEPVNIIEYKNLY